VKKQKQGKVLIPTKLKMWDEKPEESFKDYLNRMCRPLTPEERERVLENSEAIQQLHKLIVSALRAGEPYLLHVNGDDLCRIKIALEES